MHDIISFPQNSPNFPPEPGRNERTQYSKSFVSRQKRKSWKHRSFPQIIVAKYQNCSFRSERPSKKDTRSPLPNQRRLSSVEKFFTGTRANAGARARTCMCKQYTWESRRSAWANGAHLSAVRRVHGDNMGPITRHTLALPVHRTDLQYTRA